MQQNSVPYIRKFGHQTRNALGRVKSVMDFLQPDTFAQLDDEQRAMVFDVLSRGLEGSERLVDRMVRAKVFAEEELPMEDIDASSLLHKIIESHKEAFSEKSIAVQTEIEASVMIKQSPDVVNFAFDVLIENAHHYGAEGSVVYVKLSKNGAGFAFEIENKTLDTEDLSTAGQPYYRSMFADELTAGSGLSLYALSEASQRFSGSFTTVKEGDSFKAKLCL